MANQHDPDPRQQLFLKNYFDPSSPTFANCTQSGLNAGYSQEYSENLLHVYPTWLSEFVEDANLINKAEKALTEALDYLTVGEDGRIDASIARVKLDAAKLVLKGLRKDKYSERAEVTGKDGNDIQPLLVKIIGKDEGNVDTNGV